MTDAPQSDENLQQRFESLERFAKVMDEAIRIPGTNIRLGWDSLIGLLPGVGDMTSLMTHGYLIWHGHRAGIRKRVHTKMLINAGVDFLVGTIPVLGDVFDVFWRSNRKNVELLKDELRRIHRDG